MGSFVSICNPYRRPLGDGLPGEESLLWIAKRGEDCAPAPG